MPVVYRLNFSIVADTMAPKSLSVAVHSALLVDKPLKDQRNEVPSNNMLDE